MVTETVVSETVRVAYACVCSNCESLISQNVRDVSYADVMKAMTKSNDESQTFVYYDVGLKTLFRNITKDTCRIC